MLGGMGLPIEDIFELLSDPVQEVMLRTNPVLRFGMERQVTGTDIFTPPGLTQNPKQTKAEIRNPKQPGEKSEIN